MTNLKNQIAELKAGRTLAQLKIEDKKAYYKVKGLTAKLSEEKAFENGQFVTKDHLVEFKGLIIWLMKNKTNFNGYLNLKEAMTILLAKVENENITYITTKGIKSIVSKLAISAGLENAEENMRKYNGISVHASTYNTPLLSQFSDFRLNALMN